MQSPPSSVLVSINGFDIHYYGLIMFCAIAAGIFVMRTIAKKFYKDVDTEIIVDILPVIILSSILGARLYYVFMDWPYFSRHAPEILALWHGGMSIHGGILGGVISGLIYSKIKNINFLKYSDIFAYGLCVGQAIGRFGNYFNCEAFGKPCSIPFIKLFIPAAYRPCGYENFEYFHPTFLYESIWDILVFFVLLFVIRKICPRKIRDKEQSDVNEFWECHIEKVSSDGSKARGGNCDTRLEKNTKDGVIFFAYLILYSAGRIFIETCRLDSVRNFYGIEVAHIASAVMILIGIIGLLVICQKKRQDS